MAGRDFRLEVDGKQAAAYVAGDGKPGAPGILVLHAWWGLTPFFKQLCDRFAAEGFVALCANLYGDRTADTIDGATALMKQADQPFMQAVALAAIDRLRTYAPQGGLGAIGFSMGGSWAGELSTVRPDDFKAVALFYGATVPDFTLSKAAFIGNFAEHDDWEEDEWVQKTRDGIQAAGLECEWYVYPGTGHWFFEDNRPDAYNAEAARLAWERTLAFFKAKLR